MTIRMGREDVEMLRKGRAYSRLRRETDEETVANVFEPRKQA